MIRTYLKEIAEILIRGDAREESYYPALKSFLEKYGASIGKKKIAVTVLPKKTEAGNPDFRVWDGEYEITGYIEAKAPGTKLGSVVGTDQLKRYLKTFPNLILTNFYEFRLYRNGIEIDRVSIGRPFISQKLKTIPPVEHKDEFKNLLNKFFGFVLPAIENAETLAKVLAGKTHFLKDEVVAEELKEETAGSGDLVGFYAAFQKYLISNLSRGDFADLFSQTLAYGLFAARTRATDGFNRKLAYDYIPVTIGILRDVFRFVSSTDLSTPLEVMLDDIAEVLQKTNVKKILQDYYRGGKGEDPVVHFYETFLNHYDPKKREKRGVYYTPLPVVHYIVRSLHYLLKSKFKLEDGLAAKEVKLLDPAGGTLTFPVEAIKLAVKEFITKYGEGGKHALIKNQLLRNYFAFELMMAPYAIGHMKIGFILEELGYKMEPDDRFNLYLTNTLDMEDLGQTTIPIIKSLSEENRLAGKVKKEEPILVILGNPPYSGISANINEWTEKLLKEDLDGAQSYYSADGKPLGERNPKWLQDDYVKFLRFAQWKIHKAGKGVVGMITNHSYLDNPTFRGMRQSLMKTFDEIYILDLHGNSLKKETCPDGSTDQNIFDIRQGVAIALFVKNKPSEGSKPSEGYKVFHADLWGKREKKYQWLESHYVKSGSYKNIKPKSPYYFLVKRNVASIQHYLDWPSVKNIFPINGVGMTTARDSFVFDFNENTLLNRIRTFKHSDFDDEGLHSGFKIKRKMGWSIRKAHDELNKLRDSELKSFIKLTLYRPFDIRPIYYHDAIVWRTVKKVMRHMLAGENLGLTIGRQGQVIGEEFPWNLTFICQHIVDLNLYYRGGCCLFPLYLYPDQKDKEKRTRLGITLMVFEPDSPYSKKGRQPNIAPETFKLLKINFGRTPTPEKILYYIYGVLYSDTYREEYAEFLKIDFPRLPFTKNKDVFYTMAKLGQRLADLHLLKSTVLNHPTAKYGGAGADDTVEKPIYKEDERRVYINNNKYFSNVKPDVWYYYIGGYQVLAKYLKDRKGRQMDNPRHYCKVITALEKTIQIQKQIDELYPEVENSL